MKGYPKEIKMRDGKKAVIRLLSRDDTDSLYSMFQSLSAKERKFLYDDVTDRTVIEGWTKRINTKFVVPLVVEVGGHIVADATLHKRDFGPLRHVGRIRVVVKPSYLGKGLGTILTDELTAIAKSEGLMFLSCMLVEKEEAEAIEAMKALGFKKSAVIPGYAIDPKGKVFNTAIMMKTV